MTGLQSRFRQHRPFFIIVPLLVIVMTWPTLALVFDTDTFAVPTRNTDVWQKLWDLWHGQRFLAGETAFYHTDAMFYPEGVSLAYENFSLPQMLAVGLLSVVLPPANAYSLTFLLIVFAAAFSAYLYLYYLFRDRWHATLGAVVFGLSQHVTAHAAHPDVNLIVSLPLTAYFFQRAITETRFRYLVYCGVTVGLSAFFSVYIFICALMTLALIALYFARSRWRERRFWAWMLALGLFILLFSAGRVLPMLAQADDLAVALKKGATKETGADLLSYFINYWHPLTTAPLKALFGAGSPFYEPHTSYLGYLPLALIILGFAKPGPRRQMLPWLALALPFLLLRLGSVLQIDGQPYDHIIMPKALLAELLPLLIRPFHITDHFQMGLLLPLAVMTCYGLRSILAPRPAKQRALITLAAIALVAFEYYETTAPRIIPAEQFAFIEWLRDEENSGEPRLINLPMGRQPSKYYGLYQTLSGYPQVEGLSGRTPPRAYATIAGARLLRAWRAGAGVLCFPPLQSEYLAGLDQLQATGFTHVIWHRWLGGGGEIGGSFVDAQPSYRDEFVDIYRLNDLADSCNLSRSIAASARPHLDDLQASPAIFPLEGSAILSLAASGGGDLDSGQGSAAVLFGMHSYAALTLKAGEVTRQPTIDDAALAAADPLAGYSVILLVYDPRQASAQALRGYRSRLADRFKLCQRMTESVDAYIEYHLDADFPCELAIAAEPLEVRYDNGVRLGNLLVERGGAQLDLYLLWTRLPAEAHAISVQLFDADGARAQGDDFVIGLGPLARHRIDISALPAGDYKVKLILYNYASGVSLSGVVSGDGASFERELEIAPLSK